MVVLLSGLVYGNNKTGVAESDVMPETMASSIAVTIAIFIIY